MSNAENVDPNRDRSTSPSLPSTPSSFPSTLRTSVGSANHLEERGQSAAPVGGTLFEMPDADAAGTLGHRSQSRASSLSSAAKQRFDEALQEKIAEIKENLEAEIEERIRRKYEAEYATRLKSEIKSERKPRRGR